MFSFLSQYVLSDQVIWHLSLYSMYSFKGPRISVDQGVIIFFFFFKNKIQNI